MARSRSILSAAVLWILVSRQLPVMVAVLAGRMLLGYGFYRVRVWYFEKQGVDLEARMGRLHESEQARAD